MSAVNRLIVIVNVTLNKFGVPSYRYILKSTGADATVISPRAGDVVAWVVQVLDGQNVRTPPYQLIFSDPSVFGTSSLSVPNGGFSSFLAVVALSINAPNGQMKYTLAISGIGPVSDPLIQIDDDLAVPPGQQIAPTNYQILWSPDTDQMQFQKNQTGFQPFPTPPATLPVKPADIVTFLVDQTSDFDVVFKISNGHITQTPFTAGNQDIPGQMANGQDTTGKYTVRTVTDPDPVFTFNVSVPDFDDSPDFSLQVVQ